MPLPRFRPLIKVVPIKHEEKDVFLALDQQEALFDEQVALPPFAFVVASLLDGRREAADIQKAIAEQFDGVQVKPEEIETIVRDLDRHYLLETDRVRGRRREIEETYLKRPARPARFVPGSAEEVGKEIGEYFTGSAGAGKPEPPAPGDLAAVMAPHIDYRRGGSCYTFAYREIAEKSDADVYVILGVAHLSPPNPFIVTSKSYETPFGVAETDREIVEALSSRVGAQCFDYEALHRSEHSAEFQAVFLKYARPAAKFTIVPILCSSFESYCGSASPSTIPQINEFLEALREAVKGRKVCWVAGVDFAHVGPVFGDEVPLDQKLIDWMMMGDTRSLRACMEGNAEAFWNSVLEDGNRRKVCGLSATYSLLRLLDGARGKIHKYGFAPDPAGGFVSFASMSFGTK